MLCVHLLLTVTLAVIQGYRRVLVFVKAYHILWGPYWFGDHTGLKTIIFEGFDASSMAQAKKQLWSSCRQALESAGLSFHWRSTSGKHVQTEAELEDILEAFDALDNCNELFVKLLNLPSLFLT